MAAPLSDTVTLTITQDSVGLARASFGVPMVLSHNAAFAERVRTYSGILEVADDFDIDSPEYLAATALFAQNPHPTSLKIGRAALKPTLAYSLLATAANATEYVILVQGEGFDDTEVTVTSDAASTIAEIHDALITALNAVVDNNYIAAFAPTTLVDFTFTAAADDICTAVAHGFQTGDGPFQLTTSAADLPLNLLTVTDYYAIRLDANTFKLALTRAGAFAGTAVDIGDAGTGTHTIDILAAGATKAPTLPFTVTADSAGAWFSLGVENISRIAIEMTHSDPGVATDLAAISDEDDDWYALITLYNSQLYVAGVAAHIEAVRKIYIFDTCDTTSATLAYSEGDTNDALGQQASLERSRTAGIVHNSPADMAAAAWVGAVLPYDPGSATWKFKTLSGVLPVSLTSTHRANVRNRHGNSYETVAGANKTWEGTTADGDFIDVTQGIDWIYDDMTKGVYEALSRMPKVPFTDDGVALIESAIRATLGTAVDMGILAASPAPVVTVPRVSAVSAANKAIRNLPSVKWSATLSGAIHKISLVGVVSV